MKILNTHSLYYDDVNLIASHNPYIKSRKDIPEEKNRIFVSPMPAIVGEKFAQEALKLGLTICLHRFCSIEQECALFDKLFNKSTKDRIFASIGLADNERFDALYEMGCRNFIIDTANAYLQTVVNYAHFINEFLEEQNGDNFNLMVGNVHTKKGCDLYKNIKDVIIRVGIAGGSACDTHKMTAVNRGQITEIKECAENPLKNYILAIDGGISDPGKAAKAFGAGADLIIMGGYFSKAEEAQNIIDGEYKFWGCASQYNQAKFGEIRRHSEGKVLEIDKNEIKPLKTLVDNLWGGISSAVSYCGYGNLSDFIGNAVMEIRH